MSTTEKWTVATVISVLGAALAIALSVWGGGYRAGQAILMAADAHSIAVEARVSCANNRESVVELRTDVKYIREGIEEIKRAVRSQP